MSLIKKQTFLFAVGAFLLITACQTQQSTEKSANAYPADEIPISTDSEEAMQEFLVGLDILDQGNGQNARPYFEQALESDPGFVSAQMYRAFSSNSAKDWAENRDKFLAMRDQANEGEKLMMDLLEAGMEDDDVKELEISKMLVNKYPKSSRAYDNLAWSYTSFDETEKARESWAKAVELNPDFTPSISNLGTSYLFTTPKDFGRAQKYMEQVVEKLPESSRAHINLGDCYRAQNDLEGALASYTKASELDPEDQMTHAKAGHANSFLGNMDAARKNFQDSRAVSEFGIAAYNFEAYTYLYEDDHQKALDFFHEARKTVDAMDIPESNKTGFKLNCTFNCAMIARHHDNAEHLKEVIDLMRPLASQFSDDVGANATKLNLESNIHYWEGVVSVMEGDFEQASTKADMIKATLESVTDPNKLRPYHRLHAYSNYTQGNYDKALEHMMELDKDNVYDAYWMAKTHKMAGNTDMAIELFNEIVDNNFNGVGYALIRNEVKEMLSPPI